jgi:hypothetical protein
MQNKNIIRSTYTLKGDILKCIQKESKGKTKFYIQNNFQYFYKTEDIYKALLVFEALVFEESFDPNYVKLLDQEMKRNDLYYFSSEKEWTKTILDSVSKKRLGFRKINTGKVVSWKENEQSLG